jgi:hypothetical protein
MFKPPTSKWITLSSTLNNNWFPENTSNEFNAMLNPIFEDSEDPQEVGVANLFYSPMAEPEKNVFGYNVDDNLILVTERKSAGAFFPKEETIVKFFSHINKTLKGYGRKVSLSYTNKPLKLGVDIVPE